MREFRTVHNAPCRTGKSGKPGYVPTRVNVAVCQVPTGTGKAMLHPFSKAPADTAGLGGVGRIHVFNLEPRSFGFVLNEVLELAEGPAMQSRPHPDPGLDMGPDMGEVLHAEGRGPDLQGLGDDCFADLMVDVADMPPFFAGDGLQLPFGSSATVGLETAALGKVAVPVVPELTATKDPAVAGGSKVVFPHIEAQGEAARKGSGVGKVEHQIQIPDSLLVGEPGFFRLSCGQKRLLARAAGEPYGGPARGGKERKGIPTDRVGAVIKGDGGGREGDRRDWLVLGNAIPGSKRLVGVGHPMDGLADHLAAEGGEGLPHPVIDEVVQFQLVPAAMDLDERDHFVAGIRKQPRQNRKRLGLLRGRGKFEGASPFHFAIFPLTRMGVKHPFLPALKDGVSWTIR